MKTPLLITLLCFFTMNVTFAQENCSKFYPLEEGSSFEYTSYDKKGKTDGSVNYTITDVRQEGSAAAATFDMKFKDKKGKDVFESS